MTARVGADGCDDVHRARHRMPEHDLRSQDREGPCAAGLPLAQEVFLSPVEVLVRMARPALLAGHRRRFDVAAIGFGSLQDRDVAQARGRPLQGVEDVPQHRFVDGHLLRIAPAGDQVRLLVQGCVEQVRGVGETADGLAACRRVGEVRRDMDNPVRQRHLPARQRGNPPVRQRCEMGDRGGADHAARAGYQDPVLAGHRSDLSSSPRPNS